MEQNVTSIRELGELIRLTRKSKNVTLEHLSNMTGVGVRFLSEIERGKETAQIGKVLQVLTMLGLDITVRTRHDRR